MPGRRYLKACAPDNEFTGHNDDLRGLNCQDPTNDIDSALRSVSWRALSDDEMRVLYQASNLVRG